MVKIDQLTADQHVIAKIASKHGVAWDEVLDMIAPPCSLWVTRHPQHSDRVLAWGDGLEAVLVATSELGLYKVVTCYRKERGS